MLLASVTVLALLPRPPAAAELGGDKFNHIAAFVALGLSARWAWPAARWRAWFGGLMAYGLLLELLQGLTPTRHAEAADVLADAAGLAVAALLLRLLRRTDRALRATPPAPPR